MCVAGFRDGTGLPWNNLQYSFCLFSAGIIGPRLPGLLMGSDDFSLSSPPSSSGGRRHGSSCFSRLQAHLGGI